MQDIKLKLMDTDNSMVVTRGKRIGEMVEGEGDQYTVMEDGLTLGGEYAM